MNFPHRYVAQIIIEALTPLAVGSDSLYYDQDSPVDKDSNDLPYIPGTTITGFLRKQLNTLDVLFGDEPDANNAISKGSNIIISDAFLMDKDGTVLQQPQEITSAFLQHYFKLPIRQHTAINEFGTAKDSSKFDTEIVFKGSRFKFEIELQVTEEQNTNWETILKAFLNNNFYLGAGEFNNFGELKVIAIKQKHFDFKEKDLEAYLNHDVDLNTFNKLDSFTFSPKNDFYQTRKIELSGKNSFFHFGTGFGDNEADNVNYTELILDWDSNKDKEDYPFVEKFVIPGTSIKGALAHRVAFHYNKKNNNFVEDIIAHFETKVSEDLDQKYNLANFTLKDTVEELEQQKIALEKQLAQLEKETLNTQELFKDVIGTNNEGVSTLFGKAKNSANKTGKAGNIIFKDIYLDSNTPQTLFMHNKIDRYTGGTIESALFGEKVLAIDEVTLCYKYIEEDTNLTYLDMALNDLKKGMLPLGGLVNKGHGIFTHKETVNGN